MPDQSASHEDTEWPKVEALYRALEVMTGNPMVTAVHEYRYAATRSTSQPEQDYLTTRAARLGAIRNETTS